MAISARHSVFEQLDPRFGSRLTRVEIHVRDVDGLSNRPDEIAAMIEGRPANGEPITVTSSGGQPNGGGKFDTWPSGQPARFCF